MKQPKTINIQLDELIPLEGASHKDVVEYYVDFPMRYAQVVARLVDGSIARLRDARQFLGWRGYDANPSMLFTANGRQFVVGRAAENYIARDGSLVYADRQVNAA
jgi:hypothetical protein